MRSHVWQILPFASISTNDLAARMTWLLTALAVVLAGGLLAAVAGRKRADMAHRAGQWSAVAGCALGLVVAIAGLTHTPQEFTLQWNMPGGEIHLGLDALSSFFLLVVFGLGLLCAIYGREYLRHHGDDCNPASLWLHFNVLIVGMAWVIIARDGLMFMLAWEVMALAPFFLVGYEDEQEASRHAAWIYLIASHMGAVFLLVMFVLLANLAGSANFADFAPVLTAHSQWIPLILVLALLGFGSKAGFVPAHIWLPEAHPAAPSHVSALMSGAMLKVGIYGLLRILMMLGHPQPWWGWTLIIIGASSGVLGVIFALAQHNLKRLLAYHSVENIGIIVLGLGIGVLGMALDKPWITVIGLSGGLLHVLNHSIFKGLLFLGAGAVQVSAGTLDIEATGGLLKRMPKSGLTFLIGSIAIVGLPPLNGFVSEFLILMAGFSAVASSSVTVLASGITVLLALGMISGLAAACFAKAFGVVYLGEPRSPAVAAATEVSASMFGPMLILAALCILIGLAAPLVVSGLVFPIAEISGVDLEFVAGSLHDISAKLLIAVVIFVGVVALSALLWHWRSRKLAITGVHKAPTWGCGFPFYTPRMQYSASSFADPLNSQFGNLMHIIRHSKAPEGLFPKQAYLKTSSEDPFHYMVFAPSFVWVKQLLGKAEIIQRGHMHIYVLFIALTLLLTIVAVMKL